MSRITCVTLVVLIVASNTDAVLRFANYYGSGMVLQMEPEYSHIWGYGTNGTVVDVSVDGSLVNSATVAGGKWNANIPAMAAGGPHIIDIRSSEGHVKLTDVYFGDVWVCSGQSNMEYTFNGVHNYTDYLSKAVAFKNIRFMRVQRKTSDVPLEEPVIQTAWQTPGRDASTSAFSAVCLLYAMELSPHLNGRPIGLVESSWGGTVIEAWSSPVALSACTSSGKRQAPQNQPSKLWNGMIAPILPMLIYGAIWYQGESNANHATQYACQFKSMIHNWRKNFYPKSGQTSNMFPFGFVQLAAWRNQTIHTGFSDLRWSQTYDYGYVPNPGLEKVFMAVAMDLPDFSSPYGSIHPRDKPDVAIRLALAGRAVAYNEANLDYKGPFPSLYSANGHSLSIEYDFGKSILDVRNTRGFEVCCVQQSGQGCAANNWHYVPISTHDQTSITIDTSVCHGTNHVTAAVRYAWEESPCNFKQCAIYDLDTDLPAPPFIRMAPFV